jgi:hypothetical protein
VKARWEADTSIGIYLHSCDSENWEVTTTFQYQETVENHQGAMITGGPVTPVSQKKMEETDNM